MNNISIKIENINNSIINNVTKNNIINNNENVLNVKTSYKLLVPGPDRHVPGSPDRANMVMPALNPKP